MKYNLLESYKIYKRLNKLESLVYEKTVSRGDDSRAYKIWKYLRDEGPKTRPEIRDHFGWTTPIVDMEAEQCVFKNGNRYSANLDYNWEDVGVIPRTAAQELANQANDSGMETVDDEVVPARVPARRTRQPRAPRTREVKPNLFSRKFEEVKAAVDAGEDVNQRNDAGKTPLQFACSDKSGKSYDIVKLLLDSGALPWLFGGKKPNIYALLDGGDAKSILEFTNAITRNNYEGVPDLDDLIFGALYKGQHPLHYAIEECNITDTNILTALTCEGWYDRYYGGRCVDDICYNFYRTDKISASTWAAIANKAIHNVSIEELNSHVSARTIAVEIQKRGPTPVLNAFTSLGYTPPFFVGYYNLKNLDKAVLEKYYDLLVNVANGKLHNRWAKKDFLDLCSEVCNLLGRSSEFAYNFIDENYIKNVDGDELDNIISQLVYDKKPKILAKIAKLKPNNLNKKYFMSIVSNITDTAELGSDSKSITSAVCRILNNIKVKPDMRLLNWQLGNLRNSDNEYLIEYLFERDLADMFMFGISDINKSSLLSPTVKKVANKYGYNKTWDEASLKERANREEYADILSHIISRIENDDWNSSYQRWIQSNPEALREKDLVEAVNNNLENSITARQLKRMIDRLPDSTNDDKEVYDF